MDKTDKLNILPPDDFSLKCERIFALMSGAGIDTMVISSLVNKLYLTGRTFVGYIVVSSPRHEVRFFVRRPENYAGENVALIRKVEDIPAMLDFEPGYVAFEQDESAYSNVVRMAKAFGVTTFGNADGVLTASRAVKTPYEIEQINVCSHKLDYVYSLVPSLYRPGMSDIELQVEIERVTRLEGGLGIFRVGGEEMELNQGSVLAGANADTPSPYDFAMGGRGMDPSLPVGADGTVVRPGETVMVDTNGAFNAYMTDMTRTFAIGEISERARRAHELSIDILETLSIMARPGMEARMLYNRATDMVAEAGLSDYFMGHRRKAGFIGHGVGLVVNERPVIAPRSRDVLAEGNVIALEPKFVIPGTGAVGVENTYVLRADGLHTLTHAPQYITRLNK